MAFAMIGVLAGASAAPYLVELTGGGSHGFGAMSLIIAAGTAVGMGLATLTVLRWTRRGAVALPVAADSPAVSTILRDRAFVRLAAAYFLQLTGAGLLSAMTPYFVTQTLALSGGHVAAVMGALLTATIAGIPLWAWVLRRTEGYRACAQAAAGYAIACMLLWFIPSNSGSELALAAYALLGLPFAGLQLVPFVLLAHRAHAAAGSAAHQEGLYTGFWTAAEKVGLALGPAVAGIGLAALGHVSGGVAQTHFVLMGSRALIAFAPPIFLFASLLVLPSRPTT